MALKKPILLAPAGSMAALKAAVYAGADAVYFGGGSFNARAFATNFTDGEMAEAFRLCRLYGVKVYITLNTLLSDRELAAALDFVKTLEREYKPDAYIVQDIGLIRLLKNSFPQIPLHASTQLQQHSSLCAEEMKKLGISRVVLARELSREDIARAVKSGLETEIFVHGAICVCQSGGCLMSSFIGGRSGNRGKCAQPCRQCYGGKYPLSLKDMCLASHIPEICDMGVDCLKIEGRMKGEEYVYETVRIYRALIDERRAATDSELKLLAKLFSRSGFTDGYYTGKKGPSMFGVRTEDDKEKSRSLTVDIKEKKLPVSISCKIKAGKEAEIRAESGGFTVTYVGETPDTAINRPLTKEELEKRLSKTGDTAFTVTKLDVSLDGGLIMPLSGINTLRREVLTRLTEELVSSNTPVREALCKPCIDIGEKTRSKSKIKPKLVLRFEGKSPSKELLDKVISVCDRLELPLWCDRPDVDYMGKLSLVLPRIVYDSDADLVKGLLKTAKDKGVTDITLPNIGMLPLCGGFTLHGDGNLNVSNSQTALYLIEQGLDSYVISPEIAPSGIAGRVYGGEYTVYGKATLMHTENCIIRNIKPCQNKADCKGMLKDKTGASFLVLREYRHRNSIYNSVPTYLLDKRDELGEVTAHILSFTDEKDEEVIKIINAYKKQLPPQGAFTRAALKRGAGVF